MLLASHSQGTSLVHHILAHNPSHITTSVSTNADSHVHLSNASFGGFCEETKGGYQITDLKKYLDGIICLVQSFTTGEECFVGC